MLPFFSGQDDDDDDDDALAQGFHLICCLCHALLARASPSPFAPSLKFISTLITLLLTKIVFQAALKKK